MTFCGSYELNVVYMTSSVVRSIVMVLIGLLFIFWSGSVVSVLIRVIGAAFFLPALLSAVNVFLTRAQGKVFPKVLISTIDIGSMAFGLWLMIAPVSFEILFVKLLAVLLLLFALYQIVMIALGQKGHRVSAWLFVVPLLLIVVAAVLFSSSFHSLEVLPVVFGAVTVVSGLSDLLITFRLRKKNDTSAADIVKVD